MSFVWVCLLRVQKQQQPMSFLLRILLLKKIYMFLCTTHVFLSYDGRKNNKIILIYIAIVMKFHHQITSHHYVGCYCVSLKSLFVFLSYIVDDFLIIKCLICDYLCWKLNSIIQWNLSGALPN